MSSGFLGSYGITSVTAGDAWSLLAAEADRCVAELRARQIAIGASARMLCATTLHVAASAAAVGTSGGRWGAAQTAREECAIFVSSETSGVALTLMSSFISGTISHQVRGISTFGHMVDFSSGVRGGGRRGDGEVGIEG